MRVSGGFKCLTVRYLDINTERWLKPDSIIWICEKCDTEVILAIDTIPVKCYKCGLETDENLELRWEKDDKRIR